MNTSVSTDLYRAACAVTPGGVNSPVRAYRAVGGNPVFIKSGSGAFLTDVDGNQYIDCVGSWGPMILGHAHPVVVEALMSQVGLGTSFGAPTEGEVRLCEIIHEAVPCAELVRLVSSGTEATMSAVRVARGFTGRNRILKFAGNYHGHADCLLSKAGSGVATLGLPECAGVPEGAAADTITLPYNSIDAMTSLFDREGGSIACVIVEPVAGNMGCVPPAPGFLEALRAVTDQFGALLIFDEVMTGFRIAYGGAQERFGVVPDMVTLGKIVGGGLPLAAFAGREEIMNTVAPVGPVYQAGTLSGNPLAVSAGLATVRHLKDHKASIYARLEGVGRRLARALRERATNAGVSVRVNQVGAMLTVFFTDAPDVFDYDSAKSSNTPRFARWFHSLLEQGVYWPPSQFEAAFLSIAMSDADLAAIVRAADRAFLAAAMAEED